VRLDRTPYADQVNALKPVRRLARAAGAIAVVAAVLLLAGPAGPAAASPDESIAGYDTQIAVRADGSMRVTERIAYDFGGNQRHGILRDIPVRFHYDSRHDRVYPISDIQVTVDAKPVAVETSSSGSDEQLKIGDPEHTITGTHTYVVGYTVRGALNHFADHEELYWNAIGTEWDVPITNATATVTGPVDVTHVQCFAGPSGSQLGCDSESKDGGQGAFREAHLPPRSGLSTVVAFPVGSVRNTAPILKERPDPFRLSAPILAGGAGIAVAGVAVALLLGWLIGRDRRYEGQLPGLVPGYGEAVVEKRKPLLGKPPVSVEFVPPDNVLPGQVGTLIDEQANVVDVTATIIDFAVRKHLHITEIPRTSNWGTQDWMLSRRSAGDPNFLPYERMLFDALFTGRDEVTLSQLKNTFATDLGRVRGELYQDMVRQGWYRTSPRKTRAAAYAIGVLVLLGAALVTVLLAVFSHLGILGLALIPGAIALLVVAGRFPARTGRGSAVLSRIEGFRLYIATAEAEQLKFQEREQIFSRYLPYAIVFGLAERWAGIFARLGAQAPGASNGLYWYTGQPGWSLLYFTASIGSFTTTTTGSIASTPPSASGGSGFSGGFSGGGGGGGGGGSW
jgi:uncharacterized protein (TIGR04222 family)